MGAVPGQVRRDQSQPLFGKPVLRRPGEAVEERAMDQQPGRVARADIVVKRLDQRPLRHA
jgi:hypothetical protein